MNKEREIITVIQSYLVFAIQKDSHERTKRYKLNYDEIIFRIQDYEKDFDNAYAKLECEIDWTPNRYESDYDYNRQEEMMSDNPEIRGNKVESFGFKKEVISTSFHLRKPPGQQCPGRRCTSTHPPALDPAPPRIHRGPRHPASRLCRCLPRSPLYSCNVTKNNVKESRLNTCTKNLNILII
jgi:hypothetical protein